MAELVSKLYSGALFDVALEGDKLEEVAEELDAVWSIFEENPAFFELYRTPRLSIDERKGILDELFAEGLSTYTLNFLKVLLDKRRASDLEMIRMAFRKRVDEHQGRVTAIVESSVALDDGQREKLIEKLKGTLGKDVTIDNRVKPDLLGGLVIRVGDQVLDGSVKRKLSEIRESLAKTIV